MSTSFAEQLHELGLAAGDWLAVFGDVRSTPDRPARSGEVDRLLDELAAAVGPDGHLLIPTFTRSAEFHPDTTPAATGRLAERFRKRAGVLRSIHATHSIAVLGPQARDILRDHDLYLPFHVETPLGRLAEHGGKILLFGGDQKDNALIHVARYSIDRERPIFWINIVHLLEFGGRRRKRHVEGPCSRAYTALGDEFDRSGIARPIETDWGPAVWMDARAVFDRSAAIERDTPDRLLCSEPTCRWCQAMREPLSAHNEP